MKKVFYIVIAAIALSSLSACVIAPPFAHPYYGEPSRHYYYHPGRDRHWRHR